MGRRGFSQGGGRSRKAGKLERARLPDVFRGSPQRSEPEMRRIADLIVRSQAYYDAQAWDECEPLIRELLAYPEFRQPLAYDAHGAVLERQGNIRGAMEAFRRALAIDPAYVEARSRLIMVLDALPDTTLARAQKERDLWWQHHGAPNYARRKPHLNNRDPERPLRVGYVSGDFQYHSAASVFERVLLKHSDGFIPYFYSTTPHDKHDHKTVGYQSWGGWRDLRSRDDTKQGRIWPDTLIWDKIRDDQIDILVDLSGYTSCNALPVFCYKPAPIQITGWGYATGVGWKAMDYLMTDRVVVPEDRQDEHVEQMLYMPCVITYEPMDGFPVQPNALPCLTERPTFGVFQRSLKLNADEFEVWRQILERLPESRLLFKSHYPKSLVDWVKPHFGAQAHQVEFQFATSALDHKKAYAQVDLSLDCWPQTGGVSSCDSLWMGVPMITLNGPRIIQRTSASLLTILGLTDFIVDTRAQYIEQAVSWVTERKSELATIRAGLRDQCDASPIRQGYLEATEAAYRQAWRDWCAKPLSLAEERYRLEQAS
jgi:protein O-GlcNAc transferase